MLLKQGAGEGVGNARGEKAAGGCRRRREVCGRVSAGEQAMKPEQ